MPSLKVLSSIDKYLLQDSLARKDLEILIDSLIDGKDDCSNPDSIENIIELLSSKMTLSDVEFKSWISSSWLYIVFILSSVKNS